MSITLGTHSSQQILKRAQALTEARRSVMFKGFSCLQMNIYKFIIMLLKRQKHSYPFN